MRLSLLKRNVAANFAGRGLAAAISIVVIPIYIRFLGIEAYGIIGFFTTLTALSAVFDFGIATTANRELARLTAREGKAQAARDLVRTLEAAYWLCAGLLCLIMIPAAEPIATKWLQTEALGAEQATQAILIMGLVLVIQFPTNLYTGCLAGLQRQVLLNAAGLAFTVAEVVGAVLVLWLVSPSLTAFFVWHGIARAVRTGLFALLARLSLPQALRPGRFCWDQVRSVWQFAAGMGAVSIIGLLLTQIDGIILSRILPLSQFGYYMMAKSLAQGLLIFVTPIFSAVFPHFAQLKATGDESRLRESYHRASQALAVAILPVAIVVALFSPHIMWIWTGDAATVTNTSLLVSLLAVAAGLSGLQHAPYALQLAAGWTKFLLWSNGLASAFVAPSVIFLTNVYGPAGAAIAWLAMNVGAVCIAPPLTHRHLLKESSLRWYVDDCARPLLGALVVAATARWLFPPVDDRALALFVIAVVYAASALAAVATVPWLRAIVAAYFVQGVFMRRAP